MRGSWKQRCVSIKEMLMKSHSLSLPGHYFPCTNSPHTIPPISDIWENSSIVMIFRYANDAKADDRLLAAVMQDSFLIHCLGLLN